MLRALSLLVLMLGLLLGKARSESVIVQFYSEQLSLRFHPELRELPAPRTDAQDLVRFYRQIDRAGYEQLLLSLQAYQKEFALNDWLYAQLIYKSLKQILPAEAQRQREMLFWYFLEESGYDTRLAFQEEEISVYLYTTEEIFEAPFITENDRNFVNVSAILRKNVADQSAIYILDYRPLPGGRPFSFRLNPMPKLKPFPEDRVFEFYVGRTHFAYELQIDRTLVELMRDYPLIGEKEYIQTPLSLHLSNSLLPKLRKELEAFSTIDKLRFLASLTRTGFSYQEDQFYFGQSKPMIPEEVFFYPYSDCEDRSALFFALAKELIGLPMIIVAFPDHLTIGVALPDMAGDPIRYRGRDYYICDPTGPVNSTEIGFIPADYQGQPYEVIGVWF